MSYPQAVQTEIRDFIIDPTYEKTWQEGLELLGKPLTARLTTFAKKQFLDIYYQWWAYALDHNGSSYTVESCIV